jgi:hypothetical protein
LCGGAGGGCTDATPRMPYSGNRRMD